MPIQKSDFGSQYVQQVDLLLKILPIVAKESCFAIKGGTTLMPYPHLDQLPALRWKLLNIQKIDQAKQRKMIDELEKLLFVGGV